MPEEVSKYPKMPEGWNPSDDSDDEYTPAPKIATKKRVVEDDIVGTKKAEQEATSLIHFQSGVELTNPKDIKDASLQYCVQLLSNREPKEEQTTGGGQKQKKQGKT